MMRYDIEETAVYDKYVRWCGRTGPRGPSYPIQPFLAYAPFIQYPSFFSTTFFSGSPLRKRSN
jgi:hypothetical protein